MSWADIGTNRGLSVAGPVHKATDTERALLIRLLRRHATDDNDFHQLADAVGIQPNTTDN